MGRIARSTEFFHVFLFSFAFCGLYYCSPNRFSPTESPLLGFGTVGCVSGDVLRPDHVKNCQTTQRVITIIYFIVLLFWRAATNRFRVVVITSPHRIRTTGHVRWRVRHSCEFGGFKDVALRSSGTVLTKKRHNPLRNRMKPSLRRRLSGDQNTARFSSTWRLACRSHCPDMFRQRVVNWAAKIAKDRRARAGAVTLGSNGIKRTQYGVIFGYPLPMCASSAAMGVPPAQNALDGAAETVRKRKSLSCRS
jgi:hypothetical protein